MSYYAYTILECTNPELISSGSTFVKESNSDLLKIQDCKSHFRTNDSTHNEIIELSKLHPMEIFNTEWYWELGPYDRINYCFEYKNGKCIELGVKPIYEFHCNEKIPSKEVYLAFQDHIKEYFKRLDFLKKDDKGFIIDKLNNKKDHYGYESSITITYENDFYKWTAKKTGLSHIMVSIEKKEPIIYRVREFEDRYGYDELPF